MMNTENIVQTTLRDGGGTFDPKTGNTVLPQGGYSVGLVKGTAVTVSVENPDLIGDAAKIVVRRFPDAWLGTWVNDGQVHIDPVAWVDDLFRAQYLARQYHQKAIWDFANGVEIEL